MAASVAYRTAREELLAAERELRDVTERVAALRRGLPIGPVVSPSIPLTLSTGKPTTLGSLLGKHETLLVCHLMFDTDWTDPAPMSAMWVDGIDALVPHLADHTAVVTVAPADPGKLDAVARRRNWQWITVASTQPGELTDLLGLRNPEWGLEPAISVLTSVTGTLRLHWHGLAGLRDPADATADDYVPEPGGDSRGLDPYCATWPLLDLLPDGRGDWYARLQNRTS